MTPLQRIICLFYTCAGLLCAEPLFAIELPRSAAVPGGVALIELPADSNATQASFNSKPVLLVPTGATRTAVVGLPLGTRPGTHHLTLRGDAGTSTAVDFQVGEKHYREQRITIKDKRKVTPEKRDMERIGREQQRIRKALANHDSHMPDSLRFRLPVEGPVSSPFGLRRFFNDKPRKPHSGLDLAAAEGTPVFAPAGGRIDQAGNALVDVFPLRNNQN